MQNSHQDANMSEMRSGSAVTMEITLPPRRRPKVRTEGPSPEPLQPKTPNRLPRITRLMALAIKFQEMVDRGEVRDYADLARLGHVSRVRMSQIMNLFHLAPTIQENILFDSRFAACCASERSVRKITSLALWVDQLNTWKALTGVPTRHVGGKAAKDVHENTNTDRTYILSG